MNPYFWNHHWRSSSYYIYFPYNSGNVLWLRSFQIPSECRNNLQQLPHRHILCIHQFYLPDHLEIKNKFKKHDNENAYPMALIGNQMTKNNGSASPIEPVSEVSLSISSSNLWPWK